jgi:hypothetical protein
LFAACGNAPSDTNIDSGAASQTDASTPGPDSAIELADAQPAGPDASVEPADAAVEPDAAAPGPDASAPDSGPPAPIALTGCAPSYKALVRIGSQQFQMMVDTGSTSLVVASSACPDCDTAGIKPLYTPGSKAVDMKMTAKSGYASTPPVGWTAEIYEDSVSIQGVRPAATVDLAAVTTFSGPIFGLDPCATKNSYQGIIGLGPSPLAVTGTTGYLDQLAATKALPDLFAVQLCRSGGNLWVGGYDPAAATAAVQFTPMLTTGTAGKFYGLTVSELKVGGASLGLAATAYGSGFVDTGSTNLFLPAQVFTAVTAAIAQNADFQQLFGDATWFDTHDCVTVAKTKAELDAALPPLTMVLGPGPTIAVDSPATESYLEGFDDGAGGVYYCPGILKAPMMGSVKFDLGAPIMRGKLTVFDRANKQIGFAPAPCAKDN